MQLQQHTPTIHMFQRIRQFVFQIGKKVFWKVLDSNKVFNMLMARRSQDVIRYVRDNEVSDRTSHLTNYYLKSYTNKVRADIQPLSKDQLKELHDIWGDLWDAGIYNPKWNEIYTSVTGKFDPYYIPQNLHYFYVERSKLDRHFQIAFSDKNYLTLLFPTIKKPRTLVRKMKGYYADSDYNRICFDEAVSIICNNRDAGVVVKKSRESAAGRGVSFITSETSVGEIQELLESGSELQVQECVRQHPDMERLNPSSVNTVRLMTIFIDGEVILLSGVVRIGKPGSRVDNFSQGGFCCGILDDGSLTEFGYTDQGIRYDTHPNGLRFKDAHVPNYGKLVETVKRQHYFVPEVGLISWDICIDEEGDPVLIEINAGEGQIDLHQYNNGPIYGEYREKILEDAFHKVFDRGATLDFSYRCYVNSCAIEKGSKQAKKITIPDVINNRNVTRIGVNSFSGSRALVSISMPRHLKSIGESAFLGCHNLKKVVFHSGLEEIERNAFNECYSLKSVVLPEGVVLIGSRAFWDCHSLSSVYIPPSATDFGKDVFGSSPHVEIQCIKNSYAEKYAKEHNIPFRNVDR